VKKEVRKKKTCKPKKTNEKVKKTLFFSFSFSSDFFSFLTQIEKKCEWS